MLSSLIQYSLRNKFLVLLATGLLAAAGARALFQLPIGAVPDVTNNQVQVITTSRSLATQDVEQFITYPIELEMANLPGVKEIRSVSKFGLSVVTVVFDDEQGTYLPRQLIAEKLKAAEERIPQHFGRPFMGPITTGLGEIYQYTLEVDSAYRGQYSVADLRTIQDWVVKRQLSGLPGVVEVNTWGGYLKEYEVALHPDRMRAAGLSVQEVYEALAANNGVAGGGYIARGHESCFIRGEGLAKSLSDLEQVVVANRGGVPVLIRDIATVGYGHASRFGAITGNGQGEKVMGQVMMLKGASTKDVIEAVKARVAEISGSLPPGVRINPFLERSELVGKTTFTIAENLVLGCVIVVGVVLLLLGNVRSAIVVASVIPLCLLFALVLMDVFGVDANLMSLGAVDFGIIIDGAVIVVEYIAYRIASSQASLMALPRGQRQAAIDQTTYESTAKMMHSAVFGQIIIMIVFIPILSLANVEGKMFRPMALVFCFALAGALLLCFTYVPVMASLLLKPQMPTLRLSSRLIGWAERRYVPALRWGLRRPAAVIGLAAAGMAGALLLFSRMGGEFVPTLDEGDFVIQPVLKTGTSLEKTVEITTQIEQILLQFPEVAQVVSRIGAAEVPTDPMSMEESDVIIRLRPKGEWTSAATKDELADRFKEALSAIPGIGYEFTQPIEMRFNELITGVRADLAIKIFGEDLDVLSRKALEVEQAIQGIEGAADISVEKVAGLPQVSVAYRRDRLAQYGVSVEALNQILSAGFSGLSAGAIFEGERQFNVALRFEEGHRQRLDDIANTSVRLPSGGMVPFRELADIAYTQGPAKISRDNTRRRIVVGVNVRNRDLESVVKDAQAAIAQQVSLPSGYRIDYGGQFENLREARQRLMVAVPVALLLIFALLYFAFGNVRDALMIYSAIPLSAIGGVLLLFARGMPFSISAGVGFIALFGIAVLNGIVMIEHFREMEHHGHTWLAKRIMLGARQRLRPVLLTASAAALGFLPMAVSSSAGAEVQRPLATVVVGGLATATFLTLLVLPVLYSLFGRKGNRLRPSGTVAVLALLWLAVPAQAQQPATTREAAVAQALAQSPALQASALQAQAQRQLAGIRRDWAPSQFYYHFDQNNIAPNGFALRVLGLNHTLQLPAVQRTRQEVHRAQAELYGLQGGLDSLSVALAVSNAYAEAQYWEAMSQQLAHADSLLQEAVAVAQRRYQTGEAEALAWQALRAQAAETGMLLEQARMQAALARGQLQRWMPADTLLAIEPMAPWQLPEAAQAQQAAYQEAQAAVAQRQADAVRASGLPSFDLSAFGGSNALGAPWYWGIQVGVSLPLTQGAQRKQVAAAQTAAEGLRQEASAQAQDWARRLAYWQAERNRCAAGLAYYAQEGREMAHRLRQHASLRMAQGEIDFLAFVQLERQAQGMEQAHLEQLYRYNLAMAALCYLP